MLPKMVSLSKRAGTLLAFERAGLFMYSFLMLLKTAEVFKGSLAIWVRAFVWSVSQMHFNHVAIPILLEEESSLASRTCKRTVTRR